MGAAPHDPPSSRPAPRPRKLGAGDVKEALKRTGAEFRDDKLSHWAAALTYYGILSLFPALLALVSTLGLIDRGATQPLIDDLTELAPGPARDFVIAALENVRGAAGAAGSAFVIGLLVALWSASRYINGFMDASNAIWEVGEGRPFAIKLVMRVAITLLMLLLLAISALAVLVSGPIAEAAGGLLGLGELALAVWAIVKWPVLVILVSFMVAVLYWVAPNVRQPSFHLVTPGSVLAVLSWLAVSALFALYVANFGSYNETYGSFGGVAVFLVWLWLTNMAILLGAELNSELERMRQIRAGLPPEQEPFLPLRHEP